MTYEGTVGFEKLAPYFSGQMIVPMCFYCRLPIKDRACIKIAMQEQMPLRFHYQNDPPCWESFLAPIALFSQLKEQNVMILPNKID